MVTFNYHESPTRKASLPLYRMHIIRICELFCVTDEDCALKQPVPPVSSREPTAMRYNHDDITREVGQTHGHLKTERQSVFLLQWLDMVMLKTHSERKKEEKRVRTNTNESTAQTPLPLPLPCTPSRLSGLQPVIPEALLASSTSQTWNQEENVEDRHSFCLSLGHRQRKSTSVDVHRRLTQNNMWRNDEVQDPKEGKKLKTK